MAIWMNELDLRDDSADLWDDIIEAEMMAQMHDDYLDLRSEQEDFDNWVEEMEGLSHEEIDLG